MRFFYKVAMVCNLCFILSVVLRLVDIAMQKKGNTNGVLLFQPLKSTIVILGYGAILVNLLYLISLFFTLLFKTKQTINEKGEANKEKKNAVIYNGLILFFFIIQIVYFFVITI
jgi:hypothetical protein